MAGDGDSAGLGWMFELPVAAALSNLIPTVVLNKAQNISRLQNACSLEFTYTGLFLQLFNRLQARGDERRKFGGEGWLRSWWQCLE
jgi:hypothetical protein